MLTKLILLLSLLAAAAPGRADNESVGSRQRSELETIQNLNFYLYNVGLKLEPLDGNSPLSRVQLEQMGAVKSELEQLRRDIGSMDGNELLEMALLHDGYATVLPANKDARPLLAFLDSMGREECDQVSIDFLIIVANLEGVDATGDGHESHSVVQTYAKLRLQQCWQQFVESVARNLDRALGKMASPLFGFIDKLALKMKAKAKAEGPRRAVTGIRIDDKENLKLDLSDVSSSIDLPDSSQARAITSALKDIQLSTEAQRIQFVQVMRKLQGDYRNAHAFEDRVQSLSGDLRSFYRELLHQPCQQLIERVQKIVSSGNIFKGHIQETLGRALARKKEQNLRLDYQLQVYRICKISADYNSAIERQLNF